MTRIQLRIAVGGSLVIEGIDEAMAVLPARDIDELVRASAAVAKGIYSVDSEQELRKLGCKVHGSTWAVAGQDTAQHLCLAAPKDPLRVWRMLDQIALEAAFEEPDFAVTRGAIVRGICAEAPEPLRLGARPLKVLFIGANPKSDALAPFDLERSLAPLKDASRRSLLGLALREVRGPRTIESLRATLREDPLWDIVHVVAHGRRGDRNAICLETASGTEHWLPYEDFVAELQKLEGVRLFTLEVCDSSPLALQLAVMLRGVRAVGLRHEMPQEEASRMFAEMVTALLVAPSGGYADVERAFHEATRKLKTDRVKGWFLPVLYGPSESRPLADLRPEVELRRVVELVAAARHSEALDRAGGLAKSPDERVARKARAIEGEVSRIRWFILNFEELERELEVTAGSAGTADWRALHHKWSRRYFPFPPMAGARMVDVPPEPVSLQFFPRIFQTLEAHRSAVVDAVDSLARYREGMMGALLEACQQFARVGGERPSDPLKRVSALVFEVELRALLDRIPAMAQAAVESAEERIAGLERSLGALAEATEMVKRASPQLLSASSRGRLEADLSSVHGALTDLLARAFSPPSPEASLLAPGRRFDLWHWIRATGTTPLAAPPPSALSLLPELARRLSQARRSTALDWPSTHPRSLTLLANEECSVRFTAAVDEEPSPYVALASFGVHHDTSFDFLKRLSFDIDALDASERSTRMRHALRELLEIGRRLEVDVRLAECVDSPECTRRLQAIAGCHLRGEPAPDSLFAGVDDIDRAVLLAVVGRTADAARIAWSAAVTDAASSIGMLRTAFLVTVHHASLARHVRDEYLEAIRRSMALLGLIEAQPSQMDRWVRARLATYSGVVPHSDVSSHRSACMRSLTTLALDAIDAAERSTGIDAASARRLRRELHAELEGARESMHFRKKTPGGYHALRLSGRLPALGAALAGSLRALRGRNMQQLIELAGVTGLTAELFHRRVFLFSELRVAVVDPGEEALELLEPWLPQPEAADVAEPPGSRASPPLDLEETFPMHAKLDSEDASAVLRAHAAIAAVESLLEVARRELSKPRPSADVLRPALARVASLDELVARLSYRLGGEPPDLVSHVLPLVHGWQQTVQGHQTSDDPQGAAHADPKERREAMEHGCLIGDVLLLHLRDYEQAARSVAVLHQNAGAVIAVRYKDGRAALAHLETAHELDPSSSHVVWNLARAAKLRAAEHRAERRHDLAESVLQRALSVVLDFKCRHPDARGVEGGTLDDLVAELAASLKDPDEPDSGPPPVVWRKP